MEVLPFMLRRSSLSGQNVTERFLLGTPVMELWMIGVRLFFSEGGEWPWSLFSQPIQLH
jgi:hypothetical protein